ncbi:MAG: hypothetical protein KGL43_07630 [Burkholderiales bacterium]|nr:hypothetical protein [Burkholderiales bacterium]MDE2396512.1 hypothetical protein [Burkholderiales bacterium]MDE2453449.1 hypothetical protein [Burkholderiales bacterium]
MHIIVTAWLYVVSMMAVAEALSSQGTVLGALFTFVGFGLLPVALLLYIGRPRRRGRKATDHRPAPPPDPAE